MASTSTLLAGRYRLSSELGRGGMGIVWAAYDELLLRDVAVKEVHFPPSLDDGDRERLSGRTLREARAVAAVDTPSAVRVFDIVEQDGRPWIVMELLRGRTLSEALAQDGPLPQAEVARVGLALVEALDAAHAAGILHRDVKPGNVLLVEGGRVALTDFGIATATGDNGDTTSGVVLGSPSYVAPERFQGLAPGTASDFWALGATLWTAVEGRPPYAGPDAYAVVSAVASSDPPTASRCGPVLRDLLRAMMDRDPAHRPAPPMIRLALEQVRHQPAAAAPTAVLAPPLVEDFDRTTVLGAGPPVVSPRAPVPAPDVVAAPAPALPVAPPGHHAPPRRRLPALVLAAVAVLLAGAGVVLLRGHGASPQTSRGASAGGGGASAPSRLTSPAAATAGASASAATGLPAQSTYIDPTVGWSIAVPQGWSRATVSSGTRFTDPSSGRYILVATRYPAGPSALGAWQDMERSFRAGHSGYERITLQSIDGASALGAKDAADWEFRYSEGGATLHALDRALVFGDRGYAVYVQSHDDRWGDSQQVFRAAEASFRPGR